MSATRVGLLFWVCLIMIIAAGFGRYFVLAVAAAVAFVMMCVVAAAAFFGWVR